MRTCESDAVSSVAMIKNDPRRIDTTQPNQLMSILKNFRLVQMSLPLRFLLKCQKNRRKEVARFGNESVRYRKFGVSQFQPLELVALLISFCRVEFIKQHTETIFRMATTQEALDDNMTVEQFLEQRFQLILQVNFSFTNQLCSMSSNPFVYNPGL